MGFPSGSVVKTLPTNAEDVGSIPGSGRSPGRGNGNPLQYFCLENPMDSGWQSMVWKKSDTTEQLNNRLLFLKKKIYQDFNFKSTWKNMSLNPPSRLKPPAAAAKSLQSCPTLCDPRDGSPQGAPIPWILQARTLEWVAISFSNAWKWKVKVKSLSRVRLLATPCTAAYQAPLPMGFSRQEYWSGLPLPCPSTLLADINKQPF